MSQLDSGSSHADSHAYVVGRRAFQRDSRVSLMVSRTSPSCSHPFAGHTRISPIDSRAFERDTSAFERDPCAFQRGSYGSPTDSNAVPENIRAHLRETHKKTALSVSFARD